MISSLGQSLNKSLAPVDCQVCVLRQQPLRAPHRSQSVIWRSSQTASASPRCLRVQAAATAEDVVVPDSPDDSDPSNWPTGVARLRGIRGSPFKFRRVIDQIRGRSYDEALFLLDNLPYRACEDILPTLISAASNAKNNSGAAKRNLVVEECFVDDAGMYKRFQARAKGRPYKIQVKKSHITIKVKEYPDKYWVMTGPQQ